MISTSLKTLCTSINGGATIEDVLLTTLVNIGKTIFESERDWMALRKLDTSLSVSASGTSAWNTAISLAGITDFSRFHGDYPIRIFDGAEGIEYYKQVPYSRRLEYKDSSNTFCYDVIGKRIFLNGIVTLSGTLYINYIHASPDIDLTAVTDLETNGTFPFPPRFHAVLAFYAIGIQKGAVDYDEINRSMLPVNQATLLALKSSATAWDAQLQIDEIQMVDPTGNDKGDFRSNHVNIHG